MICNCRMDAFGQCGGSQSHLEKQGVRKETSKTDADLFLFFGLEEHFADFKNIDNLTLPGRWTIRFIYGWPDLPNIDQFDVTEVKMSHNISLDPKDFEVK
jgi:putative DNA base modification enzyme with NMAD domain